MFEKRGDVNVAYTPALDAEGGGDAADAEDVRVEKLASEGAQARIVGAAACRVAGRRAVPADSERRTDGDPVATEG